MELIKNVQTILGILSEHKEDVMLFIAIILTILNVLLNVFVRYKNVSKINDNANKD